MSGTKTLSDLVATSGPLKAWLESLPPDEVAGVKGWVTDCPLARCIAGHRRWPVEVDGSVLISGDVAWAREVGRAESAALSWVLLDFVKRVDRSRARRLTARHCLRLLDRAEREVGA